MAGPGYDPSMGMEAPPEGVDPAAWNQLGPNARRALAQRVADQPAPTAADYAGAVLPPSVATLGSAIAGVPQEFADAAQQTRQAREMPNPNPLPPPPPNAEAILAQNAARAQAAREQERQNALAAAPPYQPNPGLPGYNPNPGSTNRAAPLSGAIPGGQAVLGRSPPGPAPLFQNPFASMGGTVAKIQEDAEGNPIPYDKAKEDAKSQPSGPPAFVQPQAMAAPKPVTIPAHNQPLTDPAIQQELFDAYHRQQYEAGARANAALDSGFARALKADQVGEALGAEGEKLGEMERETRKNADERDKMLADFRKQIDDYSKKVAETKIDPQGAWHKMDTPGKIFAGIAAAAGGFLMGSGKAGRNVYLDRVDALNAADVHAQMQDYEAAKKRGEDMNNLYAMAYKATGDRAEAYKLAMGYGYEEMKKMTERVAALADSPIARANAAEVAAELNERQAQLGVAEKKDKVAMNKWVPAQTVGGAGAGGVSDKDKGLVFRDPQGRYWQARTEDSRKNLAKASALKNDIDNAVQEYKSEAGKLTSTDVALSKVGIMTDRMQRASSAYQRINTSVREAENMGVYNKGEGEQSAKRLAPPDNFSGNAAVSADMFAAQNAQKFGQHFQSEAPMQVTAPDYSTGKPHQAYVGQEFQAPRGSATPGFTPAAPKKK